MSASGQLEVSAARLLPGGAAASEFAALTMREAAEEPAEGWSVYQHPAGPWPSSLAFFAPLVDPGIPIIKHGECLWGGARVSVWPLSLLPCLPPPC